jgi:hypothetical protein
MSETDKTFLELCVDVRRETGGSGSGPATVVNQTGEYERIVNAVADADMLIQELWEDWLFLQGSISIVTIAAQREYSLSDLDGASDVADISTTLQKWDPESFVYKPASDDYVPLSELEYKKWRVRERLGATASIPQDTPHQVVIKPDKSLVFYPTPNDAGPITGDYQKRPTRMTANGSFSAIPAHYRRIIVVRAKMLYAEYEETAFVYNSGERDFNDYLQRLESSELPDGHWKRTSQESERNLEVRVE